MKHLLLASLICLLGTPLTAGAQSDTHWSFVKPRRPKLPQIVAGNPIDSFVRAKLRDKGWTPNGPADRVTLIRRVTLDLTGLPPTPAEVDAYVRDRSPQAYEKVVDRLLASPRYGERLALPWLDAARYADTHGYLFDTARSMWRWREWVIESFNRNQPFDQFTIEQLAGDLLPNATLSQKIATGFNRNHLINNEAGANPQEYLVENILDRVNTTATVWMGLSLACCQCHDHKYDPLTQQDYYRFYAFFNTIPELGLDGLNTNARPVVQAPTQLDRLELADLRRAVQKIKQQLAKSETAIAAAQAKWERQFKRAKPVSTEGLTGHWPLDKSPINTVNGQRALHAAATGKFKPGILGDALQLNGLGYLNAGQRFNFSRYDQFSITAWVKLQTKQGRMSLVSKMERAKGFFRGYTLQLFAGRPSLFLIEKFPQSLLQVQAKTILEPGKWYHIAATYNGSAKLTGTHIYINGEREKPTIRLNTLQGPITTDRDFYIGNGHPGAKVKGLMDDVRIYRRVLSAADIKGLPGLSIDSLIAKKLAQRTPEQRRRVRDLFQEKHAAPKIRQLFKELIQAQDALTRRQRSLPTVMVMKRQKKPRVTRMLIRGAFDRPGKTVAAGTPAVLPPFPQKRFPQNRLGLAKWLVARDHPLTARTTVNRFWQMYFGQGLVRTADDFGVQGDPPSHPRLLDWLAVEFMESGWNVKALQRLIVTSETYRQSSRVRPEIHRRDPSNRWLARGPSIRLPAELIRDQALAASGLLVGTIGGPSVKPYQPKGLWREVAFDFAGNLTAQIYKQDQGAKLYRRSMYTFWKRTSPPPAMLVFDAPDRERCVVRRARTSTPLQALMLLNSPAFVEASRKLAERMMVECQADVAKRIAFGFRLVVARRPNQKETRILRALFTRRLQQFQLHPQQSNQFLKVGRSLVDPKLNKAQLAAYSVVASVILNLHETIHKP